MSRELCDALAAWRLHRTGSHASVVERLSDALRRERPGFPDSEWHRVCAAGDPADLGTLLASLPVAGDPELLRRLDALRRFPADPRVSPALQVVVSSGDLGAPGHRPLWRRLFSMLAEVGDPRVRGWLPELVAHQRGGTPASRYWLAQQVWLVTNALPATPVDPPVVHVPREEQPWLSSMSREERLVYADRRSECGDPLGEFLMLQLGAEGLQAQNRRARELVRVYGRRWLWSLSMALRPDGLRFEGGLPVAGTLSGPRALESTGDVAWASFRALDLRALRVAVADRLERFLSHRVLRGLTSLHAVPAAQLPAVLAARPGLEDLAVLDWVGEGLAEACWSALPSLQRLQVNGVWSTRPGQ